MKIEDYKSGALKKGLQYEYFVPAPINHEWTWESSEISQLLEKAAIQLGHLNAFSQFVPNIVLFIKLHVTKEAVISSKIEGTQTNMNEALLPVEEISLEKRDDWKEVNNYVTALNTAIENLEQLPIAGRLLRSTHAILLEGVRGEHKMPGAYRSSQNGIGGATLKDAIFIPPNHELLGDLMSDFEHFLHNEDILLPDLIKIAIAHYQFETIHPFLDGNGRIGRLMITLYLVEKRLLSKPLLYLSVFFEKNKNLYFDNLTNVRTQSNMLQWIKYFLVGIAQTAEQATTTLQTVMQIKAETEAHITDNYGRRVPSALLLLNYLLQNPVIQIERAAKATNLSYKTINDLVQMMMEDGIMNELTGQSRNRIFSFHKYLSAYNTD